MTNDPFKYISLKFLEKVNSPIVFFLTEAEIQEFAEDNYPPNLSEKELGELIEQFALNHSYLCDFMYAAIRHVRGKK